MDSRGGVRDGVIILDGKTDQEIESQVREFLAGILAAPSLPGVQLDHGRSLLAEAIAHRKRGRHDFAIMFYATWVEHWVNGMILVGATRMGLEPAEARQFLRETRLPSKVGHLWTLLFGEPLPDGVGGKIAKVAKARNDFIHYKWEGFPVDEDDDRGHLQQVAALADELVNELNEVEERIVFSGRHSDLARVLAQMQPS